MFLLFLFFPLVGIFLNYSSFLSFCTASLLIGEVLFPCFSCDSEFFNYFLSYTLQGTFPLSIFLPATAGVSWYADWGFVVGGILGFIIVLVPRLAFLTVRLIRL